MPSADHQSEHLIRFLRQLNHSRDLTTLARVVLEHAISLVPGAQRGSLLVRNRETNCYEFCAAVGWPMKKLRHVAIPPQEMLHRLRGVEGPAIIREPYPEDRERVSEDLARTLESFGPIRAILTLPIPYRGEVIAYLNLDNVEDPDAFCEEDFELLAPVQEEIAIALEAVLQRERLAELERFFRMLFEKLADAVYLAAFDGTILEVNQAACEQSGYSREELIGMNIMGDLADEEPAVTYESVIDELGGGRVVRFEEVKRRKDGTPYVTDCHVSVIEYQGRQVTLSINRDVTEQRKAEESLEQRNEELEALLQSSRALTTTLDLDELLKKIQQQASSLIACDGFFVAILDKRRGRLTLEHILERGETLEKRTVDADPEKTLTGWVAHTGEPLLIGDVWEEPLPTRTRKEGNPIRSWLGVPLVAKDEPLGVMSVQSLSPYAFSEDDLRLLTTFAGLAAAVVRNAELHTGMAKLQEKLFAVEEAAREMKLAETKEELYGQLLEAMREIFGYRTSGILEVDGDALRTASLREAKIELGERLPLAGPGITVAAWNAGRTLYVPDVTADVRYLDDVPETKSELAVPFQVGDRPAGVVNVESPVENGIPPEDRNLLEILISHMAVSLAGLERLEEVRTLSEKLELLHHSVDEMQRCSSVEELCQTVVRTACDVLGVAECNVGLAEGEWLVPVASTEGVEHLSRPMRRGEGVAGKTWETGQAMWGNLSDFAFARPARQDLRSGISVPIGQEGVFQAVSTEEDAFTPSDVSLAEILAGHLREELKRIRLEEELRDQATRDPLTGLYNRRFMSEVLEREMGRAKRYGHPISVIMADIDQFKQVNDRFGHLKGDQVLQEIAALLQEHTRESDYVFRYGGEEFVILMPETADRAGEVIERLEQAVKRWEETAELGELRFGLTMGSAVWDPEGDPEGTPESLLSRADQVLYSFKRKQGR